MPNVGPVGSYHCTLYLVSYKSWGAPTRRPSVASVANSRRRTMATRAATPRWTEGKKLPRETNKYFFLTKSSRPCFSGTNELDRNGEKTRSADHPSSACKTNVRPKEINRLRRFNRSGIFFFFFFFLVRELVVPVRIFDFGAARTETVNF